MWELSQQFGSPSDEEINPGLELQDVGAGGRKVLFTRDAGGRKQETWGHSVPG